MRHLPLLLALATLPAPIANRRVHDFAALLTPATAARLESLAAGVERDTTAQLAIVTVATLDGSTVEDYANRLFKAWGIGRDARQGPDRA